MNSKQKYICNLDTQMSPDQFRNLREKIEGDSLAQWLGLFEAKIPVLPKAVFTAGALQFAQSRPTSEFLEELDAALSRFEKVTGRAYGSSQRPLLLTLASDLGGAIRNIGMGPQTMTALVHDLGQEAAFPAYVDFLETYSSQVLGCPRIDFRQAFGLNADRGHGQDAVKALSADSFFKYVGQYQAQVSQKAGRNFPNTLEHQLIGAVVHSLRAVQKSGAGDELFLHVQPMPTIHGKSARGLVYTRNPFTGRKDAYGVYQRPESGDQKFPMERAHAEEHQRNQESLKQDWPEVFQQVVAHLQKVETVFHDAMEAEWVADDAGKVHFVAFEKAELTARATIVTAVELNSQGVLSDTEAVSRVRPPDVEVLLHPTLDEASLKKLQPVGGVGVTAAPGTAVGHVFYRMNDAMEFYKSASAKERRVILIANELLISDTPGLGMISGLVTRAAGIASHAAVMARANGIPCIVGLPELDIAADGQSATIAGKIIPKGTLITLEAGNEGQLFLGEGTLSNLSFREGVIQDLAQLVTRVIRTHDIPLEVRVNINNAKDADVGVQFGADGVGLCRTENMFMEAAALREIRNIVFTQNAAACKESFDTLEATQFEDFQKIFEVMSGRVVNIRLMDLPLHDFVPQSEADFQELTQQLRHIEPQQLRAVAEGLREHNPMLGLRACRFGIIQPEVYTMQIRAIVRAAYAVAQKGQPVDPGIMFPLVFTEEELTRLKNRVDTISEEIRESQGIKLGSRIRFRVGSMIELPAAALNADRLARIGEFFAFGTNDLTQTTLGMSRDDSSHYLPEYLEKGILPADPFKQLAQPVRELIEIAVGRGHRARLDASFGICGEQGGDPSTLRFCLERGLNYVSASPFRVLIARCALVRAYLALKAEQTDSEAKAA